MPSYFLMGASFVSGLATAILAVFMLIFHAELRTDIQRWCADLLPQKPCEEPYRDFNPQIHVPATKPMDHRNMDASRRPH